MAPARTMRVVGVVDTVNTGMDCMRNRAAMRIPSRVFRYGNSHPDAASLLCVLIFGSGLKRASNRTDQPRNVARTSFRGRFPA